MLRRGILSLLQGRVNAVVLLDEWPTGLLVQDRRCRRNPSGLRVGMSTLETCSTWGVLVNRGFSCGTFPTCRNPVAGLIDWGTHVPVVDESRANESDWRRGATASGFNRGHGAKE